MNKQLLAGRIISILSILFLLMDGIMKVFQSAPAMEGSTALGWPAENVMHIGVLLTLFTVLYAIPRTRLIGAILITAYLGGAVAIMWKAGITPWFPIVFGILVWTGAALQDSRLKDIVTK